MKDKYAPWVFLGPTMVLLNLVLLVPFLYNLYISFYDYNFLLMTKSFIGIKNYLTMFKDWRLFNSFRITLSFIAIVVLAELILGLALALLFNIDVRGINFLKTLVIFPMMIAPIAIGLTWKLVFQGGFGILNYFLGLIGVRPIMWLANTSTALWACMIVDIWEWTPFAFIVLLAGLRSLPKEPFEAAKVDGAGRWQILFKITLPLLKRTILVVALFRGIDAIRIYDIIYTMTAGGPAFSTDAASYYIYRIGFNYNDIGYAAALSLFLLGFGLISVLTYMKLTKLKL